MKKNSKILLLVGIVSVFITNLTAQSIPDANPSNITAVVDEIFAMHGGQIEESYTYIHDFVDSVFNATTAPTHDPDLIYPSASLDNMDDTSISYSWAGVSGATGYRVSYLKLSDLLGPGQEEGTINTPNTDVTINSTNGLIMVMFQTAGQSNTAGDARVIIVDKPIFVDDDTISECDCANPGDADSISFPQDGWENEDNSISFDYTHTTQVGYYNVTITYDDGTVSTLLFSIQPNGEMIEIGKICEENMVNEYQGSHMFSIDESGDVLGTMSFLDEIVFDPQHGVTGEIVVEPCLQSRPREGASSFAGGSNGLNLSPNPTRSMISVSMPGDFIQGPSSKIFIMDAVGNRYLNIPYTGNALHRKVNYNISRLPTGTYYFVVQDKFKVMKTRFVKID